MTYTCLHIRFSRERTRRSSSTVYLLLGDLVAVGWNCVKKEKEKRKKGSCSTLAVGGEIRFPWKGTAYCLQGTRDLQVACVILIETLIYLFVNENGRGNVRKIADRFAGITLALCYGTQRCGKKRRKSVYLTCWRRNLISPQRAHIASRRSTLRGNTKMWNACIIGDTMLRTGE